MCVHNNQKNFPETFWDFHRRTNQLMGTRVVAVYEETTAHCVTSANTFLLCSWFHSHAMCNFVNYGPISQKGEL